MKASFKRKILLSGSIFGALLIILTAGLLLVPLVVDMESIQAKILTEISDRTKGRITFQRVTLSIFPRPHARVSDGLIDLAGAGSGRIRSLSIYPKLLPLLRGRVQADRVVLRTPEILLNLDDAGLLKRSQTQTALPARSGIEDRLREFVSIIMDRAPGFELSIKRGALRAVSGDEALLQAYAINVDFSVSGDRIRFRGKAGSNIWEDFSVQGFIEGDTLKSDGRLAINGFRPRTLYGYLFTSPRYTLGDSALNVDVSFTAHGTQKIEAAIDASSLALALSRGSEDVLLKAFNLQSRFEKEGERWGIEIKNMRAEAPRFHLTGELAHNSAVPEAVLRLEATDTDAATVREASLALGGDYKIVNRIFEIVRAGDVPRIGYHARAADLRHLGRTEHFTLRGFLTDGTILAPNVELLVGNASGEVTVENGILEGKNLAGRSGQSLGSNGFLRIDLKQSDGPFQFMLDIDADLSELPPVLHRVVKNERFRAEISLLSGVQGRAGGRLTLGDTKKDVNVRVDVGPFTLSGSYERIPYPVQLTGDAFLLDGPSLNLTGVGGTVGTSSFFGASALIDWGRRPAIEVKTTSPTVSNVVVEEVHPWITTYDWIRNILKNFEPTKGRLALDSFELTGPLFDRAKWAFHVDGKLSDLAVQSETFPAPILMKSGGFSASREEITLTKSLATFADASLTVSGGLKDYLKGAGVSSLNFDGTVGPEGLKKISEWVRIPEAFRVSSSLSVADAHVEHQNGSTLFKGKLDVAKGPRLELDLTGSPNELAIRQFSVKDDVSDATLTYSDKGKELAISFKGVLKAKTLRSLLVKNDWLAGEVQGNFNAGILVDKPGASTAKGNASVQGLTLPTNPGETIFIESALLKAEARSVVADSAVLVWRKNRFLGSGRIEFSPGGYLLDADVSTFSLDWDGIQGQAEASAPLKEKPAAGEQREGAGFLQNPSFRGAPVRGVLRVQTDRFTLGTNTWTPFGANMSFREGGTDVELIGAELCGVSTPGLVRITPSGLTMHISPIAENIPIDPVLTCLWDKKDLMTGSFDLKGTLVTTPNADWLKTLDGELEFNAKDGRVLRFGVLHKIFSVLNVTEIYRGEVPDLTGEGCTFRNIYSKGKLQNGRLHFREGILDSSCMKVVWQGYVDLPANRIEATVLVAPFKTVDTIVGHIPLLGDWLGGTLVSIPVKVSGDLSDPQVIPMAPSAVGAEFLNFMKRAFQLPFKIFQPSR